MKTTPFLLAIASLSIVSAVHAQTQTFHFGKVEARQQVTWESVSTLETMLGRTHQLTGSIQFDPKTKTGSAKIMVDAASMKSGIDLRDEHMRSAGWLDTAKYPTITFQTTKVSYKRGNTYRVSGNFTLHGVTKPITVDATVQFIPESQATKGARFDGNVVRILAKFPIKMSSYGIKVPDNLGAKVSDELTISLDIFASTK